MNTLINTPSNTNLTLLSIGNIIVNRHYRDPYYRYHGHGPANVEGPSRVSVGVGGSNVR